MVAGGAPSRGHSAPGRPFPAARLGRLRARSLLAHLLALGDRLGNAVLGLENALLDHRVHERVVEQPIRGEQEIADIGAEARETLDVVELIGQARQGGLGGGEVALRRLHLVVFEEGGRNPPPKISNQPQLPAVLRSRAAASR